MKKTTTTIAALSVAALLSATPLLASADDDYRKDDREHHHEHRHQGKPMGADFEQYSTEEMRIMAYGRALKRFGPGVKVAVEETPDGTYLIQLRDAEQNLIREQEINRFGHPVRGERRD
ncbi:hypothetical protein [Marinobacter sp. F3R08]|uniref:hypothetical protein n=1 Tax=Marinobacter sp. F3R08 TaxID=2841559 RepID=UPI001C090CC7|nr:hypothetical protein [Marinobacter sp. F3R08]MBU2954997.1 hypothetical protein [Marinobacter sp. F3R08]